MRLLRTRFLLLGWWLYGFLDQRGLVQGSWLVVRCLKDRRRLFLCANYRRGLILNGLLVWSGVALDVHGSLLNHIAMVILHLD